VSVFVYVAAVQSADAQSVRQARREAAKQKADAAEAKKAQVDKTRLRYGGKSFDQWKELFLNDVEPATRIKALPALVKLGRYGYVQEAAETIAAALADDDRELVQAAIEAMANLGAGSVPTLVEACRGGGGTSRVAALEAIEQLGAAAVEAVPSVLDLLEAVDGSREDDYLIASAAHDALAQIAGPARPLLLERLKSNHINRRILAAYVLAHIFGPAPETVPALFDAFRREDKAVRALIGAALLRAAPEDDRVISTLRKTLREDGELVRNTIVKNIYECLKSDKVMFSGIPLKTAAFLLAETLLSPAVRATAPNERPGRAVHDDARWEFRGLSPRQFASEVSDNSEFEYEVLESLDCLGSDAEAIQPQLIEIARSCASFLWACRRVGGDHEARRKR
jgi:hypothetical protein